MFKVAIREGLPEYQILQKLRKEDKESSRLTLEIVNTHVRAMIRKEKAFLQGKTAVSLKSCTSRNRNTTSKNDEADFKRRMY